MGKSDTCIVMGCYSHFPHKQKKKKLFYTDQPAFSFLVLELELAVDRPNCIHNFLEIFLLKYY